MVTVIQRPTPLGGIPVPETSSWTARPMASTSVSGWGNMGIRANVSRMPAPESATIPVGEVMDVGAGAFLRHAVLGGGFDHLG